MSDKEYGKNYLLETICAAFHESIIPEVKLNIDYLHAFFDSKGLTYKVLLDVIHKYDSNRITKLIIKDALVEQANRSEEEANHIVSKVVEKFKMNPDEIDKIKGRFKEFCYDTNIELARQRYGDDHEAYSRAVGNYKYIDLGGADFEIKDIADLDATTLTEEFLNNPIPSSLEYINKKFQGKSGYLRHSLGIVCGRPKSGKSMFLMQEAVYMATHGYNVFYLALGDLNELDFLARMSAIYCKVSLEEVYSDIEKYRTILVEAIKKAGGRITITHKPSGKLTPEEFKTIALNRLSDRDVIIVDYDLNFKTDSDNMYERGGELYDLLTEVRDETKALILVATQPNKSFWGEEMLDDTCFIESSKKSMIVDFAITIGWNQESGTHLGYFNVPINRRGNTGYKPYIMSNSGNMHTVPESLYGLYRGDTIKREFGDREIIKLANLQPPDGNE